MTGYGHSEYLGEDYQITVDIKSVNHRFLDTQIRLPREYHQSESDIKKLLKEHLSRGRVECFVTVTKESINTKGLKINWDMLDSLVKELGEAEYHRYKDYPFSAEKFLTGGLMHPDLVEIVETTDESNEIKKELLITFNQALIALNESRKKEGAGLNAFFKEYSELLKKECQMIVTKADVIKQEHYHKLKQKMTELIDESLIDESRLLSEVAVLVDKGDVTEELDRLSVHIQSMDALIDKKGPIGKEMDFLIQEMNREVNTIGSKSADLQVKSSVIQLKTLIEQIREQVQNIE